MMKKIIVLFFLVVGFLFVTNILEVSAASTFSVELRTYLDEANENIQAPGLSGKSRGEKVSFNASGISPDYTFAYYIVNGIINENLPQNYQFTVRKDLSVTAVFYPNGNTTPADARHVVVFADSNGRLLDIEYVQHNGTALDTEVFLPLLKPNSILASNKWATADGLVDTLVNITENRIYYLQYEYDQEIDFTLTVTNSPGSGTYAFNDLVTLVANPFNGEQPFSHWEDSNGNDLSYKQTYSFSMLSDRTVVAVYGATPTVEPLVTMSNDLNLRSGYDSYMGQFELPSGYSLVEYGFIFSRSSDVLTLESLGATILPSNVHSGLTKEFLRSFTEDSLNSIRAYLIVMNESSLEEVYYSKNYQLVTNHEEFNSYPVTGSSYLNGSFVGIKNISWSYVAARGDLLINGPTVTFSNTSSKLEANIPNGISELSIDYRKAFSNNASVLVYIDDVLIGTSPLSTVAGEVLNYKLTDLNIQGSFKLTLKTSGSQLSLDNLKWISYGAQTGFTPEILGVSNISITEGENLNPLSGITATDIEDGSLTSEISYTVKDNDQNTISPVDFTILPIGDYTITYSVEDSDANITSVSVVLTVLELQMFDITFESNGGSSVSSILDVLINTTIDEPVDPTKTNNLFDGWYLESNYVTLFDFSDPILSDLTLYAKWIDLSEAQTVTELWSSEPVSATSVKLIGVVAAFTDRGYILQDTTTAEMISIHDIINTPSLGDELYISGNFSIAFEIGRIINVSIYRLLSSSNVINYSITSAVDINFGSFDTQSYMGKLIKIESPYIQLTGTGSTNYVKIAGSTNGLTNEIYDGNFIGILISTYNSNLTTTATSAYTTSASQYINKALYVFIYDSSTTYQKVVIIGDNHIETLTTFQVTFDSDEGSSVLSQTIVSGNLALEPADPEKLGFAFDGWYTEPAHSNLYNFSSPVTEDISLFAKWTPITTYTVSFMDGATLLSSVEINEGDSVDRPNNPTKDSFNFDNWYTTASFTVLYNFSLPITEDTFIYAKFIAPVTVYTATIDKATTTAFTTGIADGLLTIGTGHNHISIVNNGLASFTVSFYKNSSSTTSIFNNAAGEIRLYGGSGNGGQLTIQVPVGYSITSITVNTSQNNGYSINGSATITALSATTTLSSVSSVILKNVASTTNQVRITDIVVTYIQNPS